MLSARPATSREWDDIWRASRSATYFHSREWAEIWSALTDGRMRPAPRVVRFPDSRTCLLPMSYERHFKGVARRYVSSPAGTSGGWISVDSLTPEQTLKMVEHVVSRYRNLIWRWNPIDPTLESVDLPGGAVVDHTRVLDLSAGFESIRAGWTKGHASAARKAAREGVTVRLASSREDWEHYYDVYLDTQRRWGDRAGVRYGWNLFAEMHRRTSADVRLWLAVHSGRVIAGALCLYSPTHVAYWHGAAHSAHLALRGPNLLIHDIVADACRRGHRWFDFNPSGGHAGAEAFKKGFGARQRPAPLYCSDSWTFRSLSRMTRALRGA